MALNPKQKINLLAKNFNLKSKDIVDILEKAGITGKSHMAALETEELSIIFASLSEGSQVDDIEKYMYRPKGAEPVPAPKAEEKIPAAAKEEKTEAEIKPAEAKPEPAEVKKEEPKKESEEKPAPVTAAMPEATPQTQPAAEESKSAPAAETKEIPAAQPQSQDAVQNQPSPAQPQAGTIQPRAAQPQNTQSKQLTPQQQLQKRPPQPLTPPRPVPQGTQPQQRPAWNNSGTSQQRPQQGSQGYSQRPQQSAGTIQRQPQSPFQQTTPQTPHQVYTNTQRAQSQRPSTQTNSQASRQPVPLPLQRQTSKREFTAPVLNREPKQTKSETQRRQQSSAPQQSAWQKSQGDVRTTVDVISATGIKLEAGVKSEASKIVDTRTSMVDLSKFDEKLDKFVEEKPVTYSDDRRKKGGRPSQQKVIYDRSGKPVDKEKLALEKMRQKQQELEKAKKKQLIITLPDEIIVSDLAAKLKITTGEVVKKLFMLGRKASVNENIDYETAALVAMEFGAKVEKEVIVTIEDKLFDESADTEEMLVARAPVVVVMGHVDHGKTSLLDAIKDSNVTAGEAGGITQHIGAYRVKLNEREITFLDTPGHAAFTAMRARGASVTDIAILVVAGDDGIMPQTVEAINHAKAANVSIIVAINKMDKPQSDAEKVKQELTKYELVSEDWGGDIICVPVSAVTRQGIDELLEMILLTADMLNLKANPDRLAKGVIIEAKLDKGRGPVATVLVQNGTLKTGDVVIAGTTVGRVRAMNDDRGRTIRSAGPSVPVEIVGLSETPNAGDMFRSVEDERMARELVEQRKSEEKEEIFKASSNITLEDLFNHVSSGVKELNLILKADVQGSVEALKASLIKESTEEVKIKVIHSAVGGITESDVMLASASNAIIIGFNVRPDKASIDAAESKGVDVRTYRIIYECIEEINAAMKGMLAPKFKEVIHGHAQVRQTIKVPNTGTIAGSHVQDGKILRNSQIRVVRDGIVIFEDKISSLRRFKDDVREVAQGFECGVGLEKFNDIRELDILESFSMEQIAVV